MAGLSPCSPAQLCSDFELNLVNTGSNGFEVPLRRCRSGITMIHLVISSALTLLISASTMSDKLKNVMSVYQDLLDTNIILRKAGAENNLGNL